MGINPQNKMILFQDEKASTIEAKKSQNTSLINTGIKNTFSFASPLVINGKKSEIKTSMPSPGIKENRQSICQIDSNNYAIITGKSLNRNDLINIMLSILMYI